MKCYVIVNFIFLLVLNVAGQTKSIHHIRTDQENKIEFRSGDKVQKVIDVAARNPYRKLEYQFDAKSGEARYRLKENDKISLLNSFSREGDKDRVMTLRPSLLTALSDVTQSNSFVVISDHLTLYDESGVIGVKSRAEIYNTDGALMATMPENGDGYFGPVVTDDGRYLGANFGDIAADVDYSMVPSPGFRVYDLNSRTVIYEIQPPGMVHAPVSFGDLIIQVIGQPNNRLEYYVFRPSERLLFRRVFSVEEIGNFVRFTAEGVTTKVNGTEILLRFKGDFSQSTF